MESKLNSYINRMFRGLVIVCILWIMFFIQFMTALGTGETKHFLFAFAVLVVMGVYLFRNQLRSFFEKQ